MANWSDPRSSATAYRAGAGVRTDAYDAGLRSYMLSVYNYMASGVLLTGIVAMLFAWSGAVDALFVPHLAVQNGQEILVRSPSLLGWVVMLAPLGLVLAINFGLNRMSTTTLQVLFWGYAVLMGMSLSTIFLQYTNGSIAQAFFGSAAAFGGLSLWGYTTKRDLSAFGTFLIMGLIGLVVAMFLNVLIFRSGMMDLVLSVVGVLVFAGLTAFHTQRIKSMYDYVRGTDFYGKAAIMGALQLYLDFINMFLYLLRLLGNRR